MAAGQLRKLKKKNVARQSPPYSGIERPLGCYWKNERKEKLGGWKVTIVLNVNRSLYRSMNHSHQDAGARTKADWKMCFLSMYYLMENEQTQTGDHCLRLLLRKEMNHLPHWNKCCHHWRIINENWISICPTPPVLMRNELLPQQCLCLWTKPGQGNRSLQIKNFSQLCFFFFLQ